GAGWTGGGWGKASFPGAPPRRASARPWSIAEARRDGAASGGPPVLRSGDPDDAARAGARAAGRAPVTPARPRVGDAGAVLPAEARGGGSAARRPARARRPRRHPAHPEGRAAAERGGAPAAPPLSGRAAERRRAARRVPGHDRPAHADPLDPEGSRGGPRGIGARPLALGPPPGA